MNPLCNGLTPAQREAVEHIDGPLLILAGPGSGKTRVVTHRIARLLDHGVPQHQILALTFTNKAADEMAQRVQALAPDTEVWLGTFHRFCARLLRKYAQFVGLEANYTIYDTSDSRRTVKRALAAAKVPLGTFTPQSIAASISWAKNNLITAEQYEAKPGHALGIATEHIYPVYQALLSKSNAVDFDDLLLHIATILRQNDQLRRDLDRRYRYILVDEYQDTNLAQYTIARALSIDYPNLAVTGDPDQSIYGWRGANLNNILEFERDYPKVRVVRLERNYRSTKRILRVADALIAHNVRRKQKDLFTENGEGSPVRLITYPTQKLEAESIAARIADQIGSGRRRPRDFAIFYRVNALSRSLEFALRNEGVPYQMVNGLEFFQRAEIKDILAYLHLLNNPRDDVALLRVINKPARGIGKTTLGRLTDHADGCGLTLLEAGRRCHEIDSLSSRPVRLIGRFVELFDRLAAAMHGPVEEVLGCVLSESGYQKQLEQSDNEEDAQRLANIEELLTVAREFDQRHGDDGSLEMFLEETSLVADTDAWEADDDRVTLMTLHASKGLEFPVVYLVAVEQGLLPHERSMDSPHQLEEERRLMFVGITRARQELQLSRVRNREFRGRRQTAVPSPFLMELPRGEMEIDEPLAEGSYEPVPEWLDTHQRHESDLDYDVDRADGPERPAPSRSVSSSPFAAHLTTAAELASGSDESSSTSVPDHFHQGMRVRHPKYGLGRILALSGSGDMRRATVHFEASDHRVKFILGISPLQPVDDLQ